MSEQRKSLITTLIDFIKTVFSFIFRGLILIPLAILRVVGCALAGNVESVSDSFHLTYIALFKGDSFDDSHC